MSINLNNSTPAAPTGSTNVMWQRDASGNVSAYMTNATELTTDNVDLTAQAADIVSTNLVASPVSGMYRVSVYLIVTQAATTSSELPPVTITWYDQNSNLAQSLVITPSNTGNTTTTVQQASAFLSVNSSAAIKYSTSGYASVGATPMQFALHIRVEVL